jgi:hypothetical protein
VSGSFEGDIVRPLGLVTLYFGYVETEIDELLESLSVLDPFGESMRQRSVGRKLSHAQYLLDRIRPDELADLKTTDRLQLTPKVTFVNGASVLE